MTRDVVFKEEKAWDWNTMPQAVETSTNDAFDVVYDQFAPAGLDTIIEETEVQQASSTPVLGMEVDAGGEATHTPFTSMSSMTPVTPLVASATNTTSASSWRALKGMRNLRDLYDATEPIQFEYFGLCLLGAKEPTTLQDAERDECWQCATQEEMDSIRNNHTWSLVYLPAGQRAIGLNGFIK